MKKLLLHCSVLCALIAALACTAPLPARAAVETLTNAGFRTIGIWQPEQNLRLDINVWYPTSRRPADLNYSPWTLYAARSAPPHEGRFPVLLLSHATAGTRFSYHELAAWLARCGFIVAAPAHVGDNMDDMHTLYTLEQLTGRVRHLQTTLNVLLKDDKLGPVMDASHVGIIGFNAGGTAALLMGGAKLDRSGWNNYCAGSDADDEQYCSQWATARITSLVAALPPRESLADPRVKAVAAISPMYGMLMTPASLRSCTAEVFLLETEEDMRQRSANTLLADRFPQQPTLGRLPQANVGGLMSACPRALAEELPELCNSVTPEQRQRIHHQLRSLLSDFFMQTLRTPPAAPQP